MRRNSPGHAPNGSVFAAKRSNDDLKSRHNQIASLEIQRRGRDTLTQRDGHSTGVQFNLIIQRFLKKSSPREKSQFLQFIARDCHKMESTDLELSSKWRYGICHQK